MTSLVEWAVGNEVQRGEGRGTDIQERKHLEFLVNLSFSIRSELETGQFLFGIGSASCGATTPIPATGGMQ
jgi:hypothetical protein